MFGSVFYFGGVFESVFDTGVVFGKGFVIWLISFNLFCDVIFSLMRKLCYAQYINYTKNKSCKLT